MIIDVSRDCDYRYLKEFLFSFDFPNKDIFEEQMRDAVVHKEQSAYHIAFSYEVSKQSPRLPVECNGIPILIQVKTAEALTLCEVFVQDRCVEEYRVYNIDNSELDIDKIHEGIILLEIR